MSKRVKEIDIAKGIGILLVVIGHSIPDANFGISNFYAGGVFEWIYSFHMALFMSMAGFVFYSKAISCKNIKSKIAEVKKRFVRIMVPYFVFSMIIYIAKALLSNWSRKPVDLFTLFKILFGDSPCGNMWFLWTLFVLSVIILAIPKKSYFLISMVIISVFMYFIQEKIDWFAIYGINKLCNMGIWFVYGMILGRFKGFVFKLRSCKVYWLLEMFVLLFAIQILILNSREMLSEILGKLSVKMILAFIGINMVLVFSFYISRVFISLAKILAKFGAESMTIYVLSYFVQTPGVTVYGKMDGLSIPYIVWIFGLAVGAIIFSEFTAKYIIRKSKVLRILILGELL